MKSPASGGAAAIPERRGGEYTPDTIHEQIWADEILQHFHKDAKLKILDAGTGGGYFARILSAAGHDVIGIDANENAIKSARIRAELAGVHPEFRVMETLPDIREIRALQHPYSRHLLLPFEARGEIENTGIAADDENIERTGCPYAPRCLCGGGLPLGGNSVPGVRAGSFRALQKRLEPG